jgi:hypothetical protein
MRIVSLSLAVAALCPACATASNRREPVFSHSAQFVGRDVRICGFMIDSSNIVESENREDRQRQGGLSILLRGPLDPFHRGRICVEGVISYLGCESGRIVCMDAAFDYAIAVRRVLSRSRDLTR